MQRFPTCCSVPIVFISFCLKLLVSLLADCRCSHQMSLPHLEASGLVMQTVNNNNGSAGSSHTTAVHNSNNPTNATLQHGSR